MEAFFDFLDQHPTNVSNINRLLFDMRRARQPNLIDDLNRGFLQYLSSKDVLASWDIDIIVQARDFVSGLEQTAPGKAGQVSSH